MHTHVGCDFQHLNFVNIFIHFYHVIKSVLSTLQQFIIPFRKNPLCSLIIFSLKKAIISNRYNGLLPNLHYLKFNNIFQISSRFILRFASNCRISRKFESFNCCVNQILMTILSFQTRRTF